MTTHDRYNLREADTPEKAFAAIMANAQAMRDDASQMDGTQFLQGDAWDTLARQLELAADKFKARMIKRGYPWRDLP